MADSNVRKVVAVIIARMGSTRLPGKVMRQLGDKRVIEWCIDAALAAPGIDDVVVATSTLAADNEIAKWCDIGGIPCFRGSESDVLSRFVGAAEQEHATVAVRITGDCPFHDPQVIGEVAMLQARTGCDYASNVEPRTFPDGLDVEAVSMEALRYANRFASRAIDRECVTTFIARNRHRFPAETVICSVPGLEKERWVLDTNDDWLLCSELVKRLTKQTPPSYLDILAILDREPWLRDINKHHPINERYYDALAQEAVYPRDYTQSQRLLEKAETVIPLGAQTFSKSRLQYPQPSPLFVTHGQGALTWDADGNEYVDLVAALLPNVLGYRDPDVDVAVRRQITAGCSFSLATELEGNLGERLVRLIPCAEAVRFGKNGSDATTAAIRLARAFTGRNKIIVAGGYHGWHDWAVTHTPRSRGSAHIDGIERMNFGEEPFGHIWPDGQSKDIAAIIVEPEGDPEYLRFLRKECDKYGALLIFDEVITGFRWSMGGAQAVYNVTPDLACFGKAMANGMPLSAVVGRSSIMRLMAPPDNIFYSGTFFGETLSLAASIATIDKMERENVIKKLWDTGSTLRDIANGMISHWGLQEYISLSGSDPLVRLTFKSDKVKTIFIREMAAAGVLIIASHNVCYAMTASDIMRVSKAYDHALGRIHEIIRTGEIECPMETVAPTIRGS